MRKYTIAQFNKDFPDDNACLEYLRNKYYPQKIHCPICDKDTKFHRITTRKVYGCDNCGYQISPTAGTIFHKSPTSLKFWFYAIYLMTATRCGISAKQIERETGVTYKTAWRMFNQIRSLLNDDCKASVGEFEADETYIGGKRPGKRGRGAEGKTPVFGVAQRQSEVSAVTTKDLKSATVYPLIRERALPKSMIYTDEFPVYDRLGKQGYNHERVNHGLEVYAVGKAHTNTIEGFWSLLKRGISGVYHAVSKKYLQEYVNEYVFRYNHRKDDKPMFLTVLEKI
ncbi:IS1595 family transposase [Chloroflexota bacterium]